MKARHGIDRAGKVGIGADIAHHAAFMCSYALPDNTLVGFECQATHTHRADAGLADQFRAVFIEEEERAGLGIDITDDEFQGLVYRVLDVERDGKMAAHLRQQLEVPFQCRGAAAVDTVGVAAIVVRVVIGHRPWSRLVCILLNFMPVIRLQPCVFVARGGSGKTAVHRRG